MADPNEQPTLTTSDPPVLLAILLAARRLGNRLLERVARQELEDRHGITVRVAREQTKEVPCGIS
jgi:hypothetical protein